MKSLVDYLQKRFMEERNVTVTYEEVRKNNNTLHHGIIVSKGEEKNNICPVIYIDKFIDDLNNGRDMEEIFLDILRTYDCSHDSFSYDSLKSQIQNLDNFRIVLRNAKNNDFENSVHKVVMGGKLAQVLYIELSMFGENDGFIKVTKDILNYYELDEDEVWKSAILNTRKNLVSQDMVEVLKDFFPESEDFLLQKSEIAQMVVISNRDKVNGAVAMTDTNFMKSVSHRYFKDNDMLILPSSIHECICLLLMDKSLEDCRNMVREVNRTKVSKEDFLSDEVFVYKANENVVELAIV